MQQHQNMHAQSSHISQAQAQQLQQQAQQHSPMTQVDAFRA
jgi:hypothetical protein